MFSLGDVHRNNYLGLYFRECRQLIYIKVYVELASDEDTNLETGTAHTFCRFFFVHKGVPIVQW